VLLAAGDYRGRKTGNQNTSAREVGRFDIIVNAPGKKVVVALGAYEPSFWNIHATSETSIVGVFVSGYHLQTVSDLRREIPLLNASYESKSPCGYFYLTRDNAGQADSVIRKIFGRPAEAYTLAMNGRANLGTAPSGASSPGSGKVKIERYTDENGRIGYRESSER
jgi:hypothetical protein